MKERCLMTRLPTDGRKIAFTLVLLHLSFRELVHIRTKLRSFSCPDSLGPMSLFFVTASSPCLPINRSAYVFGMTITTKKGSRLQDDNAVIVEPHFEFLVCSHDLQKETPSAQLLFWHVTWGRMEERIIRFATVEFTLRRPGTCLFDHARRKKPKARLSYGAFFVQTYWPRSLFLGGEGVNCSLHLCSMQPVIFRVPFPEGLRIITQQEKAKQTWNLFHPYVKSRTKNATKFTTLNRGGWSWVWKGGGDWQAWHISV